MSNQDKKTDYSNLLLYTIESAIKHNNVEVLDSVYQKLEFLLIANCKGNDSESFHSHIYLLIFFLQKSENNSLINNALQKKNFNLIEKIIMTLLLLKDTIDIKIHKSANDVYTLIVKNSILKNNKDIFDIYINLLEPSNQYLFPILKIEHTFFEEITFEVSYFYINNIAISSWTYHLYRFNKLLHIKPYLNKLSLRFDYRTLLKLLTTVNEDKLLNWQLWDNIGTSKHLADWVEFGITILLLNSNIFQYTKQNQYTRILKVFKDELIENCEEIINEKTKWEKLLDYDKCTKLIAYLNQLETTD